MLADHPLYYAQIAQLVEQRTENPRVAGSIPALGIFIAYFFIYINPKVPGPQFAAIADEAFWI